MQISIPVLLYVILAGVLCAILCGVAPAYQMTHLRWFQSLQESGRSETSSKGRQRLRSAMVVGEIGLAMLLLVFAGLLVRSLQQLQRVEVGFVPQGLMSASVTLPRDTYKSNEQQAAFAQALENQLKQQAGVTDAAIVNALPFSANGGSSSFEIVGQTLPPNAPPPHGNIRAITPDYFSTLKIQLVEGRFFHFDRSGDYAKSSYHRRKRSHGTTGAVKTRSANRSPSIDRAAHHDCRPGKARASFFVGAGQQGRFRLPAVLAITRA